MRNIERPIPKPDDEGYFYKTQDGTKIFIYDFRPNENYNSVIFIIAGIAGINHIAEFDIIEQLSNDENRVVVIHPRGTGYSEGNRGDISDILDLINDYIEIIKSDKDYNSKQHKILFFGHSMSTSLLLAVTDKLENVGGIILVNPPYIMKKAKGMSPSFCEYIKYACYYLFARHIPIVNMAGNPALIENEEDRRESESRMNDQLLIKYFSMNMMLKSSKLMNSMIDYCKKGKYPLLLIYGLKDNIVDKKGCDMIFEEWNYEKKQYSIVENGSHGKSTVKLAKDTLNKWIKEQ